MYSPRSRNSRREGFEMCMASGSSFECNPWSFWSLPFPSWVCTAGGDTLHLQHVLLWYSKSIGKGLRTNLQLIYPDKCHYESVMLDIHSNLTYSLDIFFWLHFSFPVPGNKPMGISRQETNQKHNGYHLCPKGTTPCTPVMVINKPEPYSWPSRSLSASVFPCAESVFP